MLSFAKQNINVKTLLANTNALVHFTPNEQSNNSLTITGNGVIKVTTRKITPNFLVDLFEHFSLPLFNEKKDSFSQEKMILLWHFSLLIPYLKTRFSELLNLPKDNLHQYYDYFMRLQGFYQHCNNLILQLTSFNELMKNSEAFQKKYWSPEFTLMQQYLEKDFDSIIKTANKFLKGVAAGRKKALVEKSSFNIRAFSAAERPETILVIQQNVSLKPERFQIGSIKLDKIQFYISASLEDINDWSTPSACPFSGKLLIQIFNNEDFNLHCDMMIYPSFSYDFPKPQPRKEIASPQDCATAYAQTQYTSHSYGTISLQPAYLSGSFSYVCKHMKSSEFLSYFITIVDIARRQKFSTITFYAPYNFSAMLYAYGFYITAYDLASPTKTEQLDLIKQCLNSREEIPYREAIDLETTENALLRPFCFDVDELKSRPVYLTTQSKMTTYGELLDKKTVINDKYPEGIFPEVHQIPLRFTGSLFNLSRRRELGKRHNPKLYYGMTPVDYNVFNTNDDLKNFALADPVAARRSKYKEMLTFKKKF